MSLTELQALTDDIANQLDSATVLEDEEQRIIAYSSRNTLVDEDWQSAPRLAGTPVC